ncbi:DUF4012 domain-containing protein [Patescibacteria group bacterium]
MNKKAKKNKKLFYLLISLGFFILITGTFAVLFFVNVNNFKNTGRLLVLDILNNKQENFSKNYFVFQKNTNSLKSKLMLVKPVTTYLPEKYVLLFNQTLDILELIQGLNPNLAEMLGTDKQKVYYILLQNNYELRPSGGFMGSYAKIKFFQGGMEDLVVQDIYIPDGQLDGHVDPPWPIQEAFKQGWWKLRDSNWEVDFPTASKQIAWFFEKGNEENADGMIALNMLFIKDLLQIVEPIILPDYNYKVTSENLYQIAQNEVEKDFFPGSLQKTSFLSSLSKHLFLELQNLNSQQLIQFIKVINNSLNKKQILVNLNDKKTQKYFVVKNWNGAVKRNYLDNKNTIADYVYLIDTNLGANKANCCVQRKVYQEINVNENQILNEGIKINYKNSSPKTGPRPPLFWGGIYRNFLRVILPIEIENIKIYLNDQEYIDKVDIADDLEKGLKTIGFFVIVNPLSEINVEIKYQKKIKNLNFSNYLLEIQKEPGIENYSHQINFKTPNKKSVYTLKVETDTIINLTK